MKKLFTRKWPVIVIAALLIALIGIIGSSASGSQGAVADLANTIFKPVRSLSSKIITMYESLYGYIYEYDKLVAENDELKRRNADLEQGYLQYDSLVKENERLKSLLNFEETHGDYDIVEATVLSWDASNWSSSFTVNLGSSNSDIAVGDGVITEGGALVGVVTSVSATTSVVKSITDTTFSASVEVGSDSTVTAQGDFELMQRGRLKLTYLDEHSDVTTGDAVITSGKGGVFPKGLLIGYVEGLYSGSGGLYLYGVIAPETPPEELAYVFIITDFT